MRTYIQRTCTGFPVTQVFAYESKRGDFSCNLQRNIWNRARLCRRAAGRKLRAHIQSKASPFIPPNFLPYFAQICLPRACLHREYVGKVRYEPFVGWIRPPYI